MRFAQDRITIQTWIYAKPFTEDNLLCVRKRKFVVTTDSNHGWRVYPNLARTLVLTGIDQLWVADLTYIRLSQDSYRITLLRGRCDVC